MTDTILRKDSEWDVIDGEPCRVLEFVPLVSVQGDTILAPNKTDPYASVILNCKKYSKPIKGFICHKVDFEHLWEAFKDRGVKQDEEVIIFYGKKQLKIYAKLISYFMPKFWVMICQKGVFELMTDPTNRPDLQGEGRFLAERPIVEWKPEVMK